VPYLLAGVLLVAVCAVGFLLTSVRVGGRVPVLALARDVPAGHVLSTGDLAVRNVAADDVGLVGVADRDRVVGRTVTVPRPAGSLLFGSDLGPAAYPPDGLAVTPVSLKAGQFPPALAPGSRVAVVTTNPPGGTAAFRGSGGTGQSWLGGVVTAVDAGMDGQGGTVVSLLLPEDIATEVAAVPAGQLTLVLLRPGSGGGGS
jgi:hypothetical protein